MCTFQPLHEWQRQLEQELRALPEATIRQEYQWLVDNRFAQPSEDLAQMRLLVTNCRRNARLMEHAVGKLKEIPARDEDFERLCGRYRQGA